MTRRPFSIWVILVIGAAIHTDWHFGRHGDHLSLGLSQHWLFAIPVFAWAAWFIHRHWRSHFLLASTLSILGGVWLGQGLEPLFERVFYGLPFSVSFSPVRLGVFMQFMMAGIATYILTAVLMTRRPGPNRNASQ